ncbi:hypothetical protein MNBD_GAMMA08-2195 [hydrothermal vent metagenome]|uniref:DUF2244 domain-containing protein n=1 Tax=hydrothermal vent metagenome TaxID=652676 RepID=A0A3B0YEU6_9ZZZZ
MITPKLNTDGFTGHILLEPNRPISWHDNIFFIKCFALVSFIIGSVAMYHGLLLVMPFSGIEVLFVSACLYFVYKHYSTCQIIYFTGDNVIIESGDKSAEQRFEYQRYWSKFHIDNKGHYNIPRLQICSKGQTTEIGEFLNYKDKIILINLVKNLTLNFQNKTHS